MSRTGSCDVLVVGAGPTGLALATQLQRFGTRFRIVDRAADRVHESRALAIQPRTLEVLGGVGVADALVEQGNPTVGLRLHAAGRTAGLPLFDLGGDDTAFPFLLFLSQAETEAILAKHLVHHGVPIEREVSLVGMEQGGDRVACTLRQASGGVERSEFRYVVGCDGAPSTVREQAGIRFAGGSYPQTFVLADLDVDGLEPGAAHVYLADAGMLFFFPLDRPAAWRLLGWPPAGTIADAEVRPTLTDLAALVDAYAGDTLRPGEPVWSTYFRLYHRQAVAYRSGRVFVAGDAAHVHSPAGAQGMNTGIQDAWNLGWKLALVLAGQADPTLLDTYGDERQPIGRQVVRLTDRAFTIATSTSRSIRFARTRVVPRLAALAPHVPRRVRARAFRTLAQLTISYRHSAASLEGRPPLRRGPRAGDRLPDAPVEIDGRATTLHQALAAPRLHVLVVGPADTSRAGPHRISDRYPGLVEVHRLTRTPGSGALHDVTGVAHHRLGHSRARGSAHYLVRPDGHIAYRAGGTDLAGLDVYLTRWFPPAV